MWKLSSFMFNPKRIFWNCKEPWLVIHSFVHILWVSDGHTLPFRGRMLFYDAVSILGYIALNGRKKFKLMNWKGFGRKWLSPESRTICIVMEGLRKITRDLCQDGLSEQSILAQRFLLCTAFEIFIIRFLKQCSIWNITGHD